MNAGMRLPSVEIQVCFVERKYYFHFSHFGIGSDRFISHHVATNISGIPSGTAQRFTTRELADTAYGEALDAGNVVQVQFNITKTVLHRT